MLDPWPCESDSAPGEELAENTLVVVGDAGDVSHALQALGFVPPLQVLHAPDPLCPDPSHPDSPLLLLLGPCAALPDGPAISAWMDRLRAAGGPPVALLVPRTEREWCAVASHPQCCGLLATQPSPDVGEVERIVTAARRFRARRRRLSHAVGGHLAWDFSTPEAADSEQVWLLLASILSDLRGMDEELPRLGMAFTEALTNAVEHGNLELASTLKDVDDDSDRFFAERRRRLADPRYAERRIRVELQMDPDCLQIRVRNQGPGFRPTDRDGAERNSRPELRPYGLGLRMIRGLVDEAEIARDGREITLRCQLSPDSGRRAA